MDMSIQFCLETPDTVAAAVAGESGCRDFSLALQDFLTLNYVRLHRRLLRHLGCPDQASDCLHDTWLRLGEMSLAAAVQSPEAYVFRMACNAAIDRLRSSMRQCTGDVDAEPDHHPDRAPGPESVAEARSDLAAVERAMQRLPQRHRAILADLRINELTRDEVAGRYGLSLRSVDTALRQALDYCAQQTGRAALAGVRAPRRGLSPAQLRA